MALSKMCCYCENQGSFELSHVSIKDVVFTCENHGSFKVSFVSIKEVLLLQRGVNVVIVRIVAFSSCLM